MNARTQRIRAISGFGLVVLFFTGFGPIAGFLTPPSPKDSPEQIAAMFDDDRNAIRVGLLMCMFSAALLVPWSAALFVQLRRAEGRFSPWPYVQMLCASLLSLEADPVFPRWSGYPNVWAAFMFTPGSLCVFFKDGPFAYNGALAWYMPVAVFAVCGCRSTRFCSCGRSASRWQKTAPAEPTVIELADELARVRQELARLAGAGAR